MKRHILLVEPDAMVASLYGDALKERGYTVVIARSAQQAIAAADKRRPDVVVLELQLARHNGVEFLYEFKSYTEWQDVPVIVLTALPARETDQYSALRGQLQVVAVLKKSETTTAQLAQKIGALLGATQP